MIPNGGAAGLRRQAGCVPAGHGRGGSELFRAVVAVLEGAHGSGPSSYFAEASFDGVGDSH